MKRKMDAIVHCPNCYQEISILATSCRYCGFSMNAYRAIITSQKETNQAKSNNKGDRNSLETYKKVERIARIIYILLIVLGVYVYISSTNNTPKFNPLIKKVSVVPVEMTEDLVGTPKLFLLIQNNGVDTIDRVDFKMKLYDVYGDEIKGNASIFGGDNTCFYNKEIKPEKQKQKKIEISLYSYIGVKYVEIAVCKYHTTKGETIEAPDQMLEYKKYEIQ